MHQDLKLLMTFTIVAETGSFAGAAKKLDLSPSIVSQHVAALESKYNAALIIRTTRSLRLTSLGDSLVTKGREILNQMDEALELLGSETEQHVGKIKISLPTMFQYCGVYKKLLEFTKRYQGIDLELYFSDRSENLIGKGIDLAVRVASDTDPSLSTRHLMNGQRILCASPDYASKKRVPEKPGDLLDWYCIRHIFASNHWSFQNKKNPIERCEVELNSGISVNSNLASLHLALLGLGVAVLPDVLALPEIESGTLLPLLEEWSPPDYSVQLVWPRNTGTHRLSSLFADFWSNEITPVGSVTAGSEAMQRY